jgi:hypothetical protein
MRQWAKAATAFVVAFIAVTVWIYRPDGRTRGWEGVEPSVPLIRQEVEREMEVASKIADAQRLIPEQCVPPAFTLLVQLTQADASHRARCTAPRKWEVPPPLYQAPRE